MKKPILFRLVAVGSIIFDRFATRTAELGSRDQFSAAVRTAEFGLEIEAAEEAVICLCGQILAAGGAFALDEHLVPTPVASRKTPKIPRIMGGTQGIFLPSTMKVMVTFGKASMNTDTRAAITRHIVPQIKFDRFITNSSFSP